MNKCENGPKCAQITLLHLFVSALKVGLVCVVPQAVCHPIWTYFGDRIARHVSGTLYERYLMWTLAGFTVLFVLIAIFEGEL